MTNQDKRKGYGGPIAGIVIGTVLFLDSMLACGHVVLPSVVFFFISIFLIVFNVFIISKRKAYNDSYTANRSKNGYLIYYASGSRRFISGYFKGVVFYSDNAEAHIGKYSEDGKVYNKDNNYIGHVDYFEDGSANIYMNRQFQFDWIVNQSEYYKKAMPYVRVEAIAGTYLGSCIEMYPNENFDKWIQIELSNSCSKKEQAIGAGAAYLVAVEDGLIDLEGPSHKFYYGVVDECIKAIKKHGRNST